MSGRDRTGFARRVWRRLRWLVLVFALLVVASAAPAVWIETACVAAREPVATAYTPILPPEHRRNPVDTYLTYPEWSIVHAYEDFAGVMRQGSESDFAYPAVVRGYWRHLCAVAGIASRRGEITADMRAMLYIIGASFTAEMVVKGLYERTVGAFTAWVRGPAPTPEDTFALRVADDYAAFLQQTPWYRYPFATELGRFWREVPFAGTSVVRTVERRIATTIELALKAVYAQVMGLVAGVSPAAETIRSVVRIGDPGALATIVGLAVIERRPDGTIVVETPRYRAFTTILGEIASNGGDVVEIAGNDEVFVTFLLDGTAQSPADSRELFAAPIQSRPGWRRLGVATRVDELARLMRDVQPPAMAFEHVYDY